MSNVPNFSLAIIFNEKTLFEKVGFGKKLHQPNVIKEESKFKNNLT